MNSEDLLVEYVPQEGPENIVYQGNKEKTGDGGTGIAEKLHNSCIL